MISTTNKKLTKADLLKGKDATKDIWFEELGGEISLRPLSSAEWSEVQAIQISKISIAGKSADLKNKDTSKMDVNIPMHELTRSQFEANVYAVKCSLGKEWSTEEVQSLKPAGIVDIIAAKVYEISGVNPAEITEMKDFRKDCRRTADTDTTAGRNPAGSKSK